MVIIASSICLYETQFSSASALYIIAMVACSIRFLYELEASSAHIYVILHALTLNSIFPLARHGWFSSLTTYGGAIRHGS